MKTTNAPYFVAILTLFTYLVVGIQGLKAQNSQPAAVSSNLMKLPGSTLKAEDVVLKTDVIIVGKISQIIEGPPATAGMRSYFAQVDVLQILQGSIDAHIRVKIDSFTINQEDPPITGSTYIFFIKETPVLNTTRNIVLKLLPATDNSVTKVKALIPAAPAGK